MNKYIIEFLGTFFLVLIIGLSQNPVAIGLGLAVLIYMGAHISGAHYNPVVSLAMLINDQIELKEFSFYLASQLLGSVVATYFIMLLGNDFEVISNTNDISSFFVAEILFTFLLYSRRNLSFSVGTVFNLFYQTFIQILMSFLLLI